LTINDKSDIIVSKRRYEMTELQTKIYEALLLSGGGYISGEKLAAGCGRSRSSVWKAINALRKKGIAIEAVTNAGYRLAEGKVSAERISERLRTKDFYNIRYENSVTSTNTILKAEAAKGADEGYVLVASEQTEGRGRFGRNFASPESGIYLSILLRPDMAPGEAVSITAAAAVAVSRAIDKVGNRSTAIKWVNDILIGGKKVCGILTEGALSLETGRLDSAVLGIGINVAPPKDGWPEFIKDTATAIFPSASEAAENDAYNRLCIEILDNFRDIYVKFPGRGFMDEYREKSLAVGRKISVIKGKSVRPAAAIAVGDDASLLVRYDGGEEEYLNSGEISIKM
jgi:BirA family biotin operon repressor/biotin-[acetyl-CoA-carboxylase] ligase